MYSLQGWEGPGVWNYTQAVEADSQFFYSGVPWDMVRTSGIYNTSFQASASALNELLQTDAKFDCDTASRRSDS